MKLHLYILALVLAGTCPLFATDTNATNTVATTYESTNKCPPEAAGATTGTTNAPENLPWSLSATGTDDKFKDLPNGLGKNSGNGPSLWRSAGATVFVLGLLMGVNYWLKKRGGRLTGGVKSERMRIVERVAVDHRRSILLIEVDGERIVASACADRIEPLAVLPSNSRRREVMP